MIFSPTIALFLEVQSECNQTGGPGAAADCPAGRGGGPAGPGEPRVLRAAEADRLGAEERAGGGDGDGQEERRQLRARRQHPEVHSGGGQGLHRRAVCRRAGRFD